MISYTFVPMAKVDRLRALESKSIYSDFIPTPSYHRVPDTVGNIYTKVTPAISQIRDREYINRLFRGVREEASSVYSDPNMRLLFSSIRDWTGLEPIKQKFPRMRQPIEALDNLRRDAETDRSWWETYFCPPEHERAGRLQERLDNPVDTFVREHPEFLLGPVSLGLQGLETAGAIAVQRVAPKLLAAGIVATSWENFVSYMNGGKDAVKKPTSSALTPRVQATKADADRYLQGLKDKKVLSDKQIARDGREYFEFKQNCKYKGIKFKKGQFLERDTQHHEWEWFSDTKTHKGPIDPITGTVNVIRAKPDRILRIK